MPDPLTDLALLERAAGKAGALALDHFRQPVEVWQKDDGPVSEADLAVDRLLRQDLGVARPDYGWLSEETADAGERLAARHLFIVDPIDGTRAFLAGDAGFSTALAVAEEGRVVAAVVHLPARRETYSAAIGQGARRNGLPIACSRRGTLERATALAAKRQLDPALWPGGAPPCDRHFRSSLAWRFCLVAAGRFDLMLTLRDSFDWDVAAGSLIAAEAGASVTDGQGRPLRFNRPLPKQAGVVAAPPLLHDQLMALRRPASEAPID